MCKPLLSAPVQAPAHPKAVFYARRPREQTPPFFDEVTRRVACLTVQPVANGADGQAEHYLCRWDGSGQLVWRTRHPSLQEALWHAEWEYGLNEAGWQKPGE